MSGTNFLENPIDNTAEGILDLRLDANHHPNMDLSCLNLLIFYVVNYRGFKFHLTDHVAVRVRVVF